MTDVFTDEMPSATDGQEDSAVKLTDEKRRELGSRLSTLVYEAISARGSIKLRWERNESFYRNQPPERHNAWFEGAEDYHVPLVQPKIDTLVASVCGTITSTSPYIIARSRGNQQSRMDELENDLHFLFTQARFDLVARQAAKIAACCGKSIVRCRFEAVTKGFEHQVNVETFTPGAISYAGITLDVIHPADFVIMPMSVSTIPASKMVGHRFYLRVAEIRAMQEAGRYSNAQEIMGGDSTQMHESGRDQSYDMTAPDMVGNEEEDLLVELWALLVRLDLDGKGERWYEATVAMSDQALLELKHYELSRPWYFDGFFHTEYGQFLPAGSVAQNLQALQILYSDIHNLLINGGMLAAFPPTYVAGSGLFADDTQDKRYGPGDLIQTESGFQSFQPSSKFNPSVLPLMIQQIERLADTVTRISQNGGTQQMKGNVTATEVAQLAQAQAQGINEYISNFAMWFEQAAAFAAELYALNFTMLKTVYGDALMMVEAPPEDGVSYEINGRIPGNTAAVRLANAQLLIPLSADPEFGLDKWQLAKAIVDATQLPNSEKIQISQEELARIYAQARGGMGVPDTGQGPSDPNGAQSQGLAPVGGVSGVPDSLTGAA